MNPYLIAFRRIIYSIPLKRLLVLLAVFSVLLASFSNADSVPDFTLNPPLPVYTTQFSASALKTYLQLYTSSSSFNYENYTVCIPDEYVGLSFSGGIGIYQCTVAQSSTSDDPSTNENCRELKHLSLYGSNNSANNLYLLQNKTLYCYNFDTSSRFIYISYGEKKSGGMAFPLLIFNRNTLKTFFNSGFVEESSIDSQYCVSNNLCPSNVLMTENQCKSIYGLISSNSCPSVPDCPDNPNIGTSNLYINDVFHPGAFNIIMNIPEEIDWDYAYTNSGQNFNLDVVGYNQDFAKIESWVNTNNYHPTVSDFTNIFKGFSNFGGLLIATLFVILVFYFIKKMFR